MTIEVVGSEAIDGDIPPLVDFAEAVLAREGVDPDAVLTVSFVGEDEMAELNLRHMGREGPTDVLAFPIEDASPGRPPGRAPGGPPLDLGDIVIAPSVVERRARGRDVAVDDELYLIVCHGLLHILGWDHQTDREADAMEAREADHLATIGRVRR